MPHYAYVVHSNPVAGREDEYNDWYSNRHLADVVAVPGALVGPLVGAPCLHQRLLVDGVQPTHHVAREPQ